MAPGGCSTDFNNIIFKFILQYSSLGTHYVIALQSMPQSITNTNSTLLQVPEPMFTQIYAAIWHH